MRDSTAISIGDAAQGNQVRSTSSARPDSSVYDLDTANMAGQFLDSPSTTSQVTYKLQANSIYSMYFNRTQGANYGHASSTITAMELKQ